MCEPLNVQNRVSDLLSRITTTMGYFRDAAISAYVHASRQIACCSPSAIDVSVMRLTLKRA